MCHASGMMTTPPLSDQHGQHLENRMIPHKKERVKVPSAEIIAPPTVPRSPVHLVIQLNLSPDTYDIVSLKTKSGASQTFGIPVGVDLNSTPQTGDVGKRPPTSIPRTPLLQVMPWSSAPPLPSEKSRLRVEAALQRSKNTQLKHRLMKKQPCDAENQLSTTGMGAQYCEQSPCVCQRCPSAPPCEDSLDEQSAPGLYPSLSPWKTNVDTEVDMNQGTKIDPNVFHHNGITGIYV